MKQKEYSRNLKRRVGSIAGWLFFGLGLHRVCLSDTAVIVTFHRVNDFMTGDALTCSNKIFFKYCEFFKRYFKVISLGTLVQKLGNNSELDRNLVITFDDSYKDNYENAAPILKAMNLPAAFFVVTEFIGTKHTPWWDRHHGRQPPWMNWDEIRSLHKMGFEIGSHTRTHADLGKVSGNSARNEIKGSKIDLQEKLGAPVEFFAYPYGQERHMTEENRSLIKSVGYRCMSSCYGGVNPRGTNPFLLKRIPISSLNASPYYFFSRAFF